MACGKVNFINEYVYFRQSHLNEDSFSHVALDYKLEKIKRKPAYKCLP